MQASEAHDAPAETPALEVGERLRSARRARAMALEQAADALHLEERVIAALEAGDFESVGAPVFVRGHLKAYARLLGLDEGPLLSSYGHAAPQAPRVQPVTRQRYRGDGPGLAVGPWLSGLAAVIVAIALALYVVSGDDGVPPVGEERPDAAAPTGPGLAPGPALGEPRPGRAQPPSVSAPGVAASAAVPTAEPTAEPEPSSRAPAQPLPGDPANAPPGSAAEAAPATAAEAPAPGSSPSGAPATPAAGGAGTVRLGLFFRAECWTEVSDRDGRLLFGLQREGTRRELAGEPPFRLLLGNARAVDVYLDGEAYAIPPARFNGDLARFEIAAADVPDADTP